VKIGIVGYSAQKFDIELAKRYLISAVMQVLGVVEPEEISDCENVEIVSGWTIVGIPGIAYGLAKEWGFKTVGIACVKAYDYDRHLCDVVHVVGKDWGDESAAFLASIDVLVRVGGGPQSLSEVEQAKRLGIPVIEYDLSSLAITEAIE
jgi:hypothetical protein